MQRSTESEEDGSTLVGDHGMDVAVEDEFEEVLVFVTMPDFDECNLLTESTVVSVENVMSEEPVCKVNNLTFTGQHEVNLGTQMFFVSDPQTGEVRFVDKSINILKFTLKTIE
jgi:hypothetical protein